MAAVKRVTLIAWSCGAPATTIPNELHLKKNENYDVNNESVRYINANRRMNSDKNHIPLIYASYTLRVLKGTQVVVRPLVQ